MSEFVIVQSFLRKLPFKLDIKKVPVENGLSADFVISLDNEKLDVVTNKEVRPLHIPLYIKHKEKAHSKELLVAAEYITPNAKIELKKLDINYIDGYGNSFLDLKKIKLYVEQGNAKPVASKYSSLFSKTAGQIIYQLLLNPNSVNCKYEDLAKKSSSSLGSIAKVFSILKSEGYIVEMSKDKKYELVMRKELLEKWILILNEKTLPANKRGTFTFSGIGRFEIKDTDPSFESFWGNESGARIITDAYLLNPQKYSLFTNRPQENLIKNFKIIPQEGGEITVYNTFWNPSNGSENNNYPFNEVAVNPLLIYAELTYSGIDRNAEVAQIIYDEHIKQNI